MKIRFAKSLNYHHSEIRSAELIHDPNIVIACETPQARSTIGGMIIQNL